MLATQLVGRYRRQAASVGGPSFVEWVRAQPELDGQARLRLDELVAAATLHCLGCGGEISEADLRPGQHPDEGICPTCASPSIKRERGGDTSRMVAPSTRLGPWSTVRFLATSSSDAPASGEYVNAHADADASASASADAEETATDRVPSVRLATSRLLPPGGVPVESAAAAESGNRGRDRSPRTPTEQIFRLTRVGNWVLERPIGQGAVGVVFRARHRSLQRYAAIKVLKASAATPRSRERFEREAQVYADLDHPNIVRLIDFGEEAGQPYLIMEWVAGRTLQAVVDEEGPQPVPRVLHMALQACHALAAAHERGIVHRDIKPDNLMLTPRGQVKITDFGVAYIEDSRLTSQGTFIGTPHFMAPEQLHQGPITPAADLYGLGATLYFLLAGHAPYATPGAPQNPHQLLLHKSGTPFPSIRQRRPDVPPVLDELLMRMGAVHPGGRPVSAAQVGLTLHQMFQQLVAQRQERARRGLADSGRAWAFASALSSSSNSHLELELAQAQAGAAAMAEAGSSASASAPASAPVAPPVAAAAAAVAAAGPAAVQVPRPAASQAVLVPVSEQPGVAEWLAVETVVRQRLAAGVRLFALDLTATRQLDADGGAVLHRTAQAARAAQAAMVVVGVAAAVWQQVPQAAREGLLAYAATREQAQAALNVAAFDLVSITA